MLQIWWVLFRLHNNKGFLSTKHSYLKQTHDQFNKFQFEKFSKECFLITHNTAHIHITLTKLTIYLDKQ